MSELLGINVLQGGAAAILALVVLFILVGRLVPRATVNDVRADRDARIAELAQERDTWRAAYMEEAAARRVAQDQVGELLEFGRTADHVLRSLPRPALGEVTDAAVDPKPAPD